MKRIIEITGVARLMFARKFNGWLLIASCFIAGFSLVSSAGEDRDAASLPEGMQRGLPKGWYGSAFSGGEYQHGIDTDRKSTRLNSSHIQKSRMPSSA